MSFLNRGFGFIGHKLVNSLPNILASKIFGIIWVSFVLQPLANNYDKVISGITKFQTFKNFMNLVFKDPFIVFFWASISATSIRMITPCTHTYSKLFDIASNCLKNLFSKRKINYKKPKIEGHIHALEIRPQNIIDDLSYDCCICLDTLVKNNMPIVIVECCEQYIHKVCLRQWLESRKNSCPLCRKSGFWSIYSFKK